MSSDEDDGPHMINIRSGERTLITEPRNELERYVYDNRHLIPTLFYDTATGSTSIRNARRDPFEVDREESEREIMEGVRLARRQERREEQRLEREAQLMEFVFPVIEFEEIGYTDDEKTAILNMFRGQLHELTTSLAIYGMGNGPAKEVFEAQTFKHVDPLVVFTTIVKYAIFNKIYVISFKDSPQFFNRFRNITYARKLSMTILLRFTCKRKNNQKYQHIIYASDNRMDMYIPIENVEFHYSIQSFPDLLSEFLTVCITKTKCLSNGEINFHPRGIFESNAAANAFVMDNYASFKQLRNYYNLKEY